MREIVLDTETTGLHPVSPKRPLGDRLIEIGCVELWNGLPTGNNYHCYINPEREMSEGAFKIHGLSQAFLADKPLFMHIHEDFVNFIKDSRIVIHNATFDVNFIRAEFNLLGKSILDRNEIIDTLPMARRKFPGSPANLDALCKRFNIDILHRDKHGALIDAELLAKVYWELTGGSQTRFSFANPSENTAPAPSAVTFPLRQFALTPEEESAHTAFLNDIPKALWNA